MKKIIKIGLKVFIFVIFLTGLCIAGGTTNPQGHPAPQVTSGTFSEGNYVFPNNITTDEWFKGKFNWTENSGYLNFTGSVLSLSSSILNNTIGELIRTYPTGNTTAEINAVESDPIFSAWSYGDFLYNKTEVYNKSQVDIFLSSLAFDFFFTNHTSDIGGHHVLLEEDMGHAESSFTSASLSEGFHVILNFTTEVGVPEFNELREGVYDARLHLFKTGTKSVVITPKLYNISADGSVKNLLVTFETSIELTDVDATYDLHGILSEEVILSPGDRLHMEFVAEVGSSGSNPTVTLDMEGTTDTHITIETSSNAFEKIFLRNDENINLTNYNITADYCIANLSYSYGYSYLDLIDIVNYTKLVYDTYDSRWYNVGGGDNASWNQSYANTLYVDIATKLGNTTAEIQAVAGKAGNYFNQQLNTSSAVTFGNIHAAYIDTGYGNNELWDMDQHVKTTSTVTFGLTTLGDSSQMATSAAPTADADLANKKYVDDNAATKEFFVIGVRRATSDYVYNINVGAYPLCQLPNDKNIRFVFYMPADFTSLTDADIVIIPDAEEEIQWDVSTNYAGFGYPYTTHSESATDETMLTVTNVINHIDVKGVLSSLAAGDYVGLTFESDTNNIRVLGLRIKYT